MIYKDNKACLGQIVNGIIKTERTKHIDPIFFFTQEQNDKNIKVEWIRSQDNHGDLFMKPLPAGPHRQHVKGIGMTRLSTLLQSASDEQSKET